MRYLNSQIPRIISKRTPGIKNTPQNEIPHTPWHLKYRKKVLKWRLAPGQKQEGQYFAQVDCSAIAVTPELENRRHMEKHQKSGECGKRNSAESDTGHPSENKPVEDELWQALQTSQEQLVNACREHEQLLSTMSQKQDLLQDYMTTLQGLEKRIRDFRQEEMALRSKQEAFQVQMQTLAEKEAQFDARVKAYEARVTEYNVYLEGLDQMTE